MKRHTQGRLQLESEEHTWLEYQSGRILHRTSQYKQLYKSSRDPSTVSQCGQMSLTLYNFGDSCKQSLQLFAFFSRLCLNMMPDVILNYHRTKSGLMCSTSTSALTANVI